MDKQQTENPVRILQVVFQMNRAGLETMLMNYYRHLDRQKVQMDFLMCHDGAFDYDEEILSMGGRIFHLPPLSIQHLAQHLRMAMAFFFEHPEYRVVHCHLDALSLFPLWAAWRKKIPVRITHSHNNDFERDWKYPLRLLAKALLPPFATHFWACSEDALWFMFRLKGDLSSKTAIIPNAIDGGQFVFSPEKRQKIRQALALDKKYVVGHIGRFVLQKNHEYILSVFTAFHKIHRDSVLLLVGEGPKEETIRRRVAAAGLEDSVILLPPQEDVSDLYSAMDVFFLPSRFEGFGMVLLEAQASGLPCVVSDKVSPSSEIWEYVWRLSLNNSLEEWAEVLWAAGRRITTEERQHLHPSLGRYDIHTAAKELQARYLELSS